MSNYVGRVQHAAYSSAQDGVERIYFALKYAMARNDVVLRFNAHVANGPKMDFRIVAG